MPIILQVCDLTFASLLQYSTIWAFLHFRFSFLSSISSHSSFLHWILSVLFPSEQYSRSFSFLHSFLASLSPICLTWNVIMKPGKYFSKSFIEFCYTGDREISDADHTRTCTWTNKFAAYLCPRVINNVTKKFHFLSKTLASFYNVLKKDNMINRYL